MKKLISKISIVAFAIVTMAGCSKTDPVTPDPATGTNEFYASVQKVPSTKMTADVNFPNGIIHFTWEVGDVVTIFNEGGTVFGDFKVKSLIEGGSKAIFGTDDNSLELEDGASYTVVYPATTATTLTDRNAEEVAEQIVDIQGNNNGGNDPDYIGNVCRLIGNLTMAPAAEVALAHETAVMVYNFNTTGDVVPTNIMMQDGSNSYNVSFATGMTPIDTYDAYIAIKPNSGTRTLSFTPSTASGSETPFVRETNVEYVAGRYYTAITAEGTFYLNGRLINRVNGNKCSSTFVKQADGIATFTLGQFSMSSAMGTPTALGIPGVTYQINGDVTTFEGNNLTTESKLQSFPINNIKGEIKDNYVHFSSNLMVAMSGDPLPYQLFYNGPVAVSESTFSWNYDAGFYINKSSGKDKIEGVSIILYKGDNTLVVKGFTPSSAMPASGDLVIPNLTIAGNDIKTTFIGTSITSKNISFAGSLIKTIKGEIVNLESMFSMTVDTSPLGVPGESPCTYYGAITIEEGSHDTVKYPEMTGGLGGVINGGVAF